MALTIKTGGNGIGNSSGFSGNNYVDGYNVGSYSTGKYNASGTLHVDDSYYYTKAQTGGLNQETIDKITSITRVTIYGFMAFAVLLLLICAIGGADAMTDLLPFIQFISVISSAVIIFDIVFSFIYVKHSIALILGGIFLSGVYPIIRGWILDREIDKIAVILDIALFVSGIFLIVSL